MSENTAENVGSANEDSRKYKKFHFNRFEGKKPTPRVSNDKNFTELNARASGFNEHNQETENDQKRPFGKAIADRIEDKIAQLSYNATANLPPFNLPEKKFGGKNRIYIANIGNDFTKEDLEALFKPYGEISEIFINIDKHFAFVKFDYYSNAQKAQRELDGVTLKTKTLKMKSSPSCFAVKIKNLTPYVTNELLYHAFSVFGEIESAKVLVDEKGRSIGEGIIDFVRKNCAMMAIQKCKEKCYFLTYSLKPVVVEHYDFVDQSVGLLDKHFNMRNIEFNQARSTGPRLAEYDSFDHEYGSRWKSVYDLYRQKEEALRLEFRLECEKLEAQMEYARFEHETETLREQLRQRELDKERQKRGWEVKERLAEEERFRAEAHLLQAEKEIQTRLSKQQDAMKRRQEDEANLFVQAKNLTSILDTQEMCDVPSSIRELQCSMSSQVRYQVHAYWGVNIRELHIFLWRPWADIKNACAAGDFLKGYYQCLGVQLERKPHPDQVITLNYNCQKPLDLGTPPRLCYPLVIFLIRNGINENVHPDETVALINVVHIKDSVCTLPTSILGQYLKQANGQLSCLKQLYLATGNSGNFESALPLAVAEPVEGGPSSVGSFCQNNEDSTFWNSSGEQLCVVCQTYPLSRALLPCRHTCICASCFNKLERCPMCRGPIKSYFCIRGEEYMHTKENNTSPKNEEGPPARRRWFNGIQNWDDRLIDFLGFSR